MWNFVVDNVKHMIESAGDFYGGLMNETLPAGTFSFVQVLRIDGDGKFLNKFAWNDTLRFNMRKLSELREKLFNARRGPCEVIAEVIYLLNEFIEYSDEPINNDLNSAENLHYFKSSILREMALRTDWKDIVADVNRSVRVVRGFCLVKGTFQFYELDVKDFELGYIEEWKALQVENIKTLDSVAAFFYPGHLFIRQMNETTRLSEFLSKCIKDFTKINKREALYLRMDLVEAFNFVEPKYTGSR